MTPHDRTDPAFELTQEEQDAWHYELSLRAWVVKNLEEALARPDSQYGNPAHTKSYRYMTARISAAIIARDAVAAEFDRLMDQAREAASNKIEEVLVRGGRFRRVS